jgi:hypothetical protein
MVQLIPVGLLLTTPTPVPLPDTPISAGATIKFCVLGPGVNVAVIVSFAVIVIWQTFPVCITHGVGEADHVPNVPAVVSLRFTMLPLG